MRRMAFVYFGRTGLPIHAVLKDVPGDEGDWAAVKRVAITSAPNEPFACVDCLWRCDVPVGRSYFARFTGEHLARVEQAEFTGPLI